ncbi:MAG: hypothetical protein KAI69_06340 [Deltaproteobacteria bacterium]|nr:hypothetical protein [Deltaproteobacteria bacterium]
MKNKIVTLTDIEQVEETPIEKRLVAGNTYDMIRHGASLNPQAPALSFLWMAAPTKRQPPTPMRSF